MIRAGIVRAGAVRAGEPREGEIRGEDSGSAPLPDLTLALPGSDAVPFDEFHARRGIVGGQLARGYFTVTAAGVNRVYDFEQGGSSADPTVHVASLASYTRRSIDLGASTNTPAQVVAAAIAALALDGITATDGGADSDGRRLLVISGANAVGVPPAVTLDRRERGMWGAQRDNWGTGSSFAVDLNATGATGGTGYIHLGNPSSQSGMSGRIGRVIGVYLWADGGFAPRLAAFAGAAYSLTPGALTTLGQGVASGITGPGFGGVLFEAQGFSAAANLWATYRENAAGGPRYRLHGEVPEGRGDVALSQRLGWDTAADPNAATAFGGTYTPTNSADFGIYISIGVIFELQDSNGNYPATGEIVEYIGDQNPDENHGTQFDAGVAFLTGETTHQRYIFPAWTNYTATAYRRAVTAIAADETSRPALHGPWTSLTHPAGAAPALISDADVFPVPMSVGWNDLTFATPIPLATAAASGQHLSVGANYVTTTGAAIVTWTLPVFLDEAAGDNCWIDCWADDRLTWHDNIIGASGSRALPSGQQEYRTLNNAGMPNTTSSQRYPDPMAIDAGDDSPIAIALERLTIYRPGMALAS